jgi:hypothetical protein
VLPVRIHVEDGIDMIDSQAANGLRLWLQNCGEGTLLDTRTTHRRLTCYRFDFEAAYPPIKLLAFRDMKVLERHVIKRGALGLFHGMDCYTACSRYSSNPHFVDDVAVNDKDFVSESEPASRFVNRNKLRIAYAGRVHRVN